jgi:hypothetical protein
MDAIQVQQLRKEFKVQQNREGLSGALRDLFDRRYNRVVAVDDISFSIPQGEICGYIGIDPVHYGGIYAKSESIPIRQAHLSTASTTASVEGLPVIKRSERLTTFTHRIYDYDTARDMTDQAMEAGEHYYDQSTRAIRDTVQSQPIGSLLIAAAAGFALAWMMQGRDDR